ncbi:MAG: HD domain-containing protein [Planctomycetota bacterium]|nr:HD domain-containing protein [Planctomycetota bacterium]
MSKYADGRYHLDICEMTSGTRVDGAYSLVNPQVAPKRDGSPYFKCLVRDATGQIPGRLWSIDPSAAEDITRTGYAWISGCTETYKDQIQLKIEEISAYEPDDQDLAVLLPHTKFDVEEMYTELVTLMRTVKNPMVRAIVDAYIEDEPLMRRFRQAPAAVSLHHAFIGGLLEHTLQLLKIANSILPLYPDLNRDLVLLGLFLHDLGKGYELQWQKGFEYTLTGNLVGHIVFGVQLLGVKIRAAEQALGGERIPLPLRHCIEHIVLSHHGKREFGSPVVPSTPEAVFVSQLDNLDAKTALAIASADREHLKPGQGFSDKIWALETSIYRPDPTQPPSPAATP